MNMDRKLLFVSSLCLLVWGSPVQGDMNSSVPMTVTIEKKVSGSQGVLPQEDQNAYITSQVRVALRNIPGFVEDKVIIKTDRGVVTLTGTVADENVKTMLEENANSVIGVDSVKNDLKIEKK